VNGQKPDFLNVNDEDPRRIWHHFSGADGATYQPFLSSSHMGDTEMHGIKKQTQAMDKNWWHRK